MSNFKKRVVAVLENDGVVMEELDELQEDDGYYYFKRYITSLPFSPGDRIRIVETETEVD